MLIAHTVIFKRRHAFYKCMISIVAADCFQIKLTRLIHPHRFGCSLNANKIEWKLHSKMQQTNYNYSDSAQTDRLSAVADGEAEKLSPNCGNCLGSCWKFDTVCKRLCRKLKEEEYRATDFWASNLCNAAHSMTSSLICRQCSGLRNCFSCNFIVFNSKQMFRIILNRFGIGLSHEMLKKRIQSTFRSLFRHNNLHAMEFRW